MYVRSVILVSVQQYILFIVCLVSTFQCFKPFRKLLLLWENINRIFNKFKILFIFYVQWFNNVRSVEEVHRTLKHLRNILWNIWAFLLHDFKKNVENRWLSQVWVLKKRTYRPYPPMVLHVIMKLMSSLLWISPLSSGGPIRTTHSQEAIRESLLLTPLQEYSSTSSFTKPPTKGQQRSLLQTAAASWARCRKIRYDSHGLRRRKRLLVYRRGLWPFSTIRL